MAPTLYAAALQLERKSASGQHDMIRGIAGFVARYDSIDRQRQRFARGAFTASLREIEHNRIAIPLLLEHNQPAGRWTHFIETAEGVRGEASIDPELPGAATATKLIAAGLGGLSVGFVPAENAIAYDPQTRALEIEHAELVEASVTAVPANALARVLSTKSLGDCDTVPEVREALREQGLSARQSKALAPIVLKTLIGQADDVDDVDVALRLIAQLRTNLNQWR
jgi:HK97 family phage prohead protease